ncbi:hypothetical protein GQ55_2G190700 [Panicum hallii var. hallii]|uniref:Uncharacterized protein n=1 Tax=Panicum hallii var. hallii TaxID=1504633 RepID=A0A2T7EQD2_9POAL|nr:hypothetical protein GQ55_2G190700 [Panicum hallii var. hallii]
MHFVSHLLSHSCGRAEQTNGGAATAGGGSPCHLAVPCLAVCGGAFSCGRVQAESMVWERTLRRTRPAKCFVMGEMWLWMQPAHNLEIDEECSTDGAH